MITAESHTSLKELNTFGLSAKADKLYRIKSKDQLTTLYQAGVFQEKHLILGGGSNILILNDVKGAVAKIEILGIEVLKETKNEVLLEVGAGEGWHTFVTSSLQMGYNGIENLSLIPGTVGAAPMQNIGAYGVELKDVFYSLTAFNKSTGKFKVFRNKSCQFGYRTSVFKEVHKDKYVICSVIFKLRKDKAVNLSYGAIESTLEAKGIERPSPQDVAQAVIEIRSSKLPDPAKIGNAGSFFKNPYVNQVHFQKIQRDFPAMPYYKEAVGSAAVSIGGVSTLGELYKIPAGWLIEKAGFKGKNYGTYGVHDKQALVLVNYGDAKGKDIAELAKKIQLEVSQKFKISLQTEVNFID